MLRLRPLLALAMGALLLSCAQVPDSERPDLEVDNASTIPVALLVNGEIVAVIEAQAGHRVIASGILPALPWRVEARSPGGRALLSFTIGRGTITSTTGFDGHGSQTGAGARIDLSCGRIDVWAGPPLAGPAPGRGTPGDCAD